MYLPENLLPTNPLAQATMWTLGFLFLLWCVLLAGNAIRHIKHRRQIRNAVSAADFLKNACAEVPAQAVGDDSEKSPALQPQQVFENFLIEKSLKPNGIIATHLRAIFEAGSNESPLDARSLLKNTSDDLFRANGLLRSLLSIFIILGLLGTLVGLSDTLRPMEGLLRNVAEGEIAIAQQTLPDIFKNLKSAFAPSIAGVAATVAGILLLAFYLRFIVGPLAIQLERTTLHTWIPQLVPTASRKLMSKLQIGEQQVLRSMEAANQVAQFAVEIQDRTGKFATTLDAASIKLNQMTAVSENLRTFSESFVSGVTALQPFQTDLRSLYQQMQQESAAFQDGVQKSIAGSREFQEQVQKQLNSQHDKSTQMLAALQSYEAAYVTSRERIDEKLEGVLVQAEGAFKKLGQRNDELVAALDGALGAPLRSNLTGNFDGVRLKLQEHLTGINDSLLSQLGSVAQRLGGLDGPINAAAENFSKTFANFDETNRRWMEKLQREFASQNATGREQLQRLEAQGKEFTELMRAFSESGRSFSETSGNFAGHTSQLNTGVATLAQSMDALGKNVESLREQRAAKEPVGLIAGEARALELMEQVVQMLRQVGRKIDALAATQEHQGESGYGSSVPSMSVAPRLSWWARFFGRRQ